MVAPKYANACYIGSRQAAIEGGDLPSEAEGGANDGVANELGAAKDEQTHVNIVPGWRLWSRPGLGDGRSSGGARQGNQRP
jgi:hypothetical protein